MTDNDIIKALECCLNNRNFEECNECGYVECMTDKGSLGELLTDALDLINRQKVEIEQYAKEQHDLMIEKDKLFDIAEKQRALLKRYKAMVEKMKSIMDCYEETSGNKKARAEAITEFEERCARRFPSFVGVFNKIAKEMKGEQE